MENVIVIAAGKTGKKKGSDDRTRGARSGRGNARRHRRGEDDDCVDRTARDLASCAALLWANLLAVLVETAEGTGLRRDLIHEFLDRLDDANDFTLPEDGYELGAGFIQVIRERLPSND